MVKLSRLKPKLQGECPMDNNTRKLLNLTNESLVFEENWLSQEARHCRSVNMIFGRLVEPNKQCPCPECGFTECVKNGTY